MKRVNMAGIIFVLILLVCCYTLISVKFATEKLTDLISQIEYSVLENNHKEVVQLAEEFSDTWDDYEEKLIMVIRQNNLDEITMSIVKMKSYLGTKTYPQAISEIHKIKVLLHHIYEDELPLLHNIL